MPLIFLSEEANGGYSVVAVLDVMHNELNGYDGTSLR